MNQEIPSVEAPPDEQAPSGALGVGGGWALATLLTKQDVQAWGVTTTTRLIVGYQYASSKTEAVGGFVELTQERNPGFSLGEIVSIKLPPAGGEAPNQKLSDCP